MRQDLLNALRLVRDYCQNTDCENCEIPDTCSVIYEDAPNCWKIDESEVEDFD